MSNEINSDGDVDNGVSGASPEISAALVTPAMANLRLQVTALITALVGAGPQPSDGRMDQETLRRLCALGHEQNAAADPFRALLIDAGLDKHLAGELKNVYQNLAVRAELLKPLEPITWQDAVGRSRDALVREIRRILDGSDQAESDANGGRFAQLCRLARKWSIDPESFCAMLVRADLTDSRASEIKCVLECVTACRDLIRDKNAISWRQALIQARQHRPQISGLLQAARGLIGPVVRHWEFCHEFSPFGLKFKLKREKEGKFILEHEEGVLTIEPIMPASEPNTLPNGETTP